MNRYNADRVNERQPDSGDSVPTSGFQAIANNLAEVRRRIVAAAQRGGRTGDEVILVAVTKTRPLSMVEAAYQAGVRHFGENRVEEGRNKIPAFVNCWSQADPGGKRPQWHMIGHVQQRKAADVWTLFDWVHSLDSLKLARRFERLAVIEKPPLPVLLEINVSGEDSKYGFSAAGWEHNRSLREGLFIAVEEIGTLSHLRMEGLMTMAPIVTDPEQARPVFAGLRKLRDALRERFPAFGWQHLSMGMTDDYEVAVEEGATMVRIGRAIFDIET